MSVRIIQGDCREVLRTLPAASVDSIVTDPPYELGFMGKGWDKSGVANDVRTWAECLRVLKPGGYLLAFSGTRTYHRMACAIEDAGFEIRDQIGWAYGSGFPKSHNGAWGGTALKPAWEPVCMARKPLHGTVAANFAAHGTGGLNIDGCRVPHGEGAAGSWGGGRRPGGFADVGAAKGDGEPCGAFSALGRWPANLLHDGSDEVLAAFPQASGAVAPVRGTEPSAKTGTTFGQFGGRAASDQRDGGGSAARFFYCAKADRADRNEGLHDPGPQFKMGRLPHHAEKVSAGGRGNHHPTVKPTDLMRYLCRLVTPAGGTVLDPFMGSGSTLKAAELEGFSAIGIELDAEYIAIARRRIAADAPLFAEVEA